MDENNEKGEKKTLILPRPIVIQNSPMSNPYFQKLSPLSPRSMKLLHPNYNGSNQPAQMSPGVIAHNNSSRSTGSSSSSVESDCLTAENGSVFDFHRKASESLESNANDIEFFLQVVSTFTDYVNEQLQLLEVQYDENYRFQQDLQRAKKKSEQRSTQEENQLSRDIAFLVSLLHQKQMELKSSLKERNQLAFLNYREQEDKCRQNMKIIAELIVFAKRLRNDSGQTMKESLVRELKERLSGVSYLDPPEMTKPSNKPLRIDVEEMKKLLRNLELKSAEDDKEKIETLFMKALYPRDDITSSSITARWHCTNNWKLFDVQWKYVWQKSIVEKEARKIKICYFVINNLPSNCHVAIRVRRVGANEEWCRALSCRTLEDPISFNFDSSTAHVKIRMSSDKNEIQYNGEKSASPKSPNKFSLALNVLGNQTFSAGKHYWEMIVNDRGWACGAAYQNVPRNSWFGSNPESWVLHHNPEKFSYKVRHAGLSHEVDVDLEKQTDFLKRIGIFVDFEKCQITFVDPLRMKILYTYTEDRFEHAICAAANPFYNGGILTLVSGLNVPEYLMSSW